jgi:signal transduction histidine kinase
MRPRLTIRARVAAWCALLVTAAGAIVLTGVLILTQNTLNANAPKPSLYQYSNNPVVLRSEQFAMVERDQLLVDHTVSHVRTIGLIGLGGTALLSVVIGWLVAGRMLRPATRLADAARQITATSLNRRIEASGPQDELRTIADAFDGMLDRLDDAFVRQRRFVADAAHELRTPFALLRSKLDVTLDDGEQSPQQLRATMADLDRILDRGAGLVDAMLSLSRAEALVKREPVDLAELVAEVLTAAPGATTLDIRATLRPAVVTGDPVLLAQLVTNLIQNAIAYNFPSGRLEASTAQQNGVATLRIANDGPLIEQAEVASLFQRFHRHDVRDRASGGFGLGLSVVDAIARTHEASLQAIARPAGGLAISLSMPIAAAMSTATATSEDPPRTSR